MAVASFIRTANEVIESGGVKGFNFQEFFGHRLKLIAMISKDGFGVVIGRIEDLFDFGINLLGCFLAAITSEGAIHERGISSWTLPLSAMDQPDTFTHAKEANHLPGESRGMLEIVFGAGGDFVENEFFGGATTKHAANPVGELRARHQEAVIGRKLHGIPKSGATARDNA